MLAPHPLAQCRYEGCRHPWSAGWRFCPNCGTDGFPALPRQRPGLCEHEFDIIGPFCVRCGFDTEAPFGLQPGVRQVVGGLAVVLATGLLLADGLLLLSNKRYDVRLGAYLIAPLIALLFIVSRLIVPRRTERTR